MQISFLQNVPPQLNIVIDNIPLQKVQSFTLLGFIIQSGLKWNSQVQQMVSHATRRLIVLCTLKKYGVSALDLVEIYKVFIGLLMEFGVPVWGSGITRAQSDEIE